MFVIDRLLLDGVWFVLDKIALTVDRELNDEETLRQALLDLQMRLELGEVDPDEAAQQERDLLARLKEAQAERPSAFGSDEGAVTVTGADISVAEELSNLRAPRPSKRRR